MTNFESEKEEYILTKDEEEKVLENEIIAAKKLAAWRMFNIGFSEEKLKEKMAQIDFEKEINKEEIFQRANSSKQYEIWLAEKRKKDIEEENLKKIELKNKCDAKYMFNVMAWTSKNIYDKKLIVHNDNKFLITVLCYFLSGDERFENELGFSFKKGLLIRGISGLGKTFLVQCLSNNDYKPISVFSMIDISETVKDEGDFKFETDKLIYLDDVGSEEYNVKHYGTNINFFKNFIEKYYLVNTAFNRLILSTNNNFSELESKYGFRVRSRLKDMFNVIDVQGNDMRG